MDTDRQGSAYADDIVDALNRAGLSAIRDDRDGLPSLAVANPALTSADPYHRYFLLSERITVRRQSSQTSQDQWLLYWSWGEALGPAANVSGTVDLVARVLGHTIVRVNA